MVLGSFSSLSALTVSSRLLVVAASPASHAKWGELLLIGSIVFAMCLLEDNAKVI